MSKHSKTQLQRFEKTLRDRVFDLSKHTCARVGLGHTGGHLKIKDWLHFQTSFAQAKDAVHNSHFDIDALIELGKHLNLETMQILSQTNNHIEFLLRPDLGELLAKDSEKSLTEYLCEYPTMYGKDLLIVISGGLSPLAIQNQIPYFLPSFICKARLQAWSIAPLLINPNGRVALGDHANLYFKAKVVIMLIGERPGLSTPHSMGIYFTYNAQPGCTNDQRNCISNIHHQGLKTDEAVAKLIYLLKKTMAMQLSGIELKDDFLTGS